MDASQDAETTNFNAMKLSFSLKWLFVGIAFLALLCGWIVDRRRLVNQHQMELYLSDAIAARYASKLGKVEHENAELRKQLGKAKP